MAATNGQAPGRVGRRQFLMYAGALGGAAALAGCGTGGKPVTAKGLVLPAEGKPRPVPGQYISKVANVPPAYVRYPAPYQTVFETPGSGGTISAFLINYDPPPPSNNRWLDQLNKNLGVTLQPTLMTPDDVATKTQALIASGDMPDIFYLNLLPGQAPAAATSVLQGAFTDLTDYLSGDAIKEYPNLALIPSYTWENCAIEGHFYGVPHQVTMLAGSVVSVRTDWLRKMGMGQPANADEMYAMLTGFTKMKNPNGQQAWAFSSLQIYWQDIVLLMMYGVPNNWRQNPGGTFTKDIETDEFAEATAFMRRLWKAGAYHPNAPGNSFTQELNLWYNGQIGCWGTDVAGVYTKPSPAIPGISQKDWWNSLGPLVAPGRNGGQARQYQGNPGGGGGGNFGIFAIPSSVGNNNKAKVKEILRILNYTAAPFGSKEFTFMEYGIEGWNFSFVDGIPTTSSVSSHVAEMAPHYFCQPIDNVLYLPYTPETGGLGSFSLTAQRLLDKLTPDSIGDPTATLVSKTNISQGPNLQQQLNNAFVGVVTGRSGGSVSAGLKAMIQQWKSQGGDTIRHEFEAALAKTK